MENVSSHERVLALLTVLAQLGRPASAGELMQATGLAKSTLYRQLAMLKRWGFVFETGNVYAPGPVSLQLALGFNAVAMLTHYAQDDLQWLSQRSRETVAITVAVHRHAVCVDMIEAPQSLRCSFEKGRSVPLRAGATATCLLAHLPELALQNIVQAECPDKVRQSAWLAQLAEIRARGYACSSSEVDEGVWGVCFPIFTRGRFLLGGLTLMAPLQRITNQQDAFIQLTSEAAQRLNARLENL